MTITDMGDDHPARPDDDPEPGDRCKDCGLRITWIGPSHLDWLHCWEEAMMWDN